MLDFNNRETTDYSDVTSFIRMEQQEAKRHEKENKKYQIKTKDKKTNSIIKIGSFSIDEKNVVKLKKILAALGVAAGVAVVGITIHETLKEEPTAVAEEVNNPYDEYKSINYTVKYGDSLWNLAKNAIEPGATDAQISEKVKEIKENNISLWDKDSIHEGEEIKIIVSVPCLTKFGFIYDASYQLVAVSDQIEDKMSYLDYIFDEYHYIIDTEQEKKIYAEDFKLYSEIQGIYDKLTGTKEIDEEERINLERKFLENFECINTDLKLNYADNHTYLYEFEPKAHEPLSEDLLDPFARGKLGL